MDRRLILRIQDGRIHDTYEGSCAVWWAYIHKYDRKVHLKRWFLPLEGELCDLQYAQREMEQGNDNIYAIVDKPFTAPNRPMAEIIAVQLFQGMGVEFKNDMYKDPTAVGFTSAELNRFHLLDLDDDIT